MKLFTLAVFLFVYTESVLAQNRDSTMLYIYKPKKSGLGKATVLLNDIKVGELKSGTKIHY